MLLSLKRRKKTQKRQKTKTNKQTTTKQTKTAQHIIALVYITGEDAIRQSPLIFQIAATNIISITVGLSLKYKNQMIRYSKPPTACYEDTISTSSNLKNQFFTCINFKTSVRSTD